MTLGCFCKFDHKNRIHVPMKIFESAGFKENGSCFVSYEEGSEEIKLTIKQREPRRNAGYTIVKTVRIGDSEFVAGEREGGSAVTWQYSNIGGYFWGHYFGSLEEALADLYKRAAEDCRMKADRYEERAKNE